MKVQCQKCRNSIDVPDDRLRDNANSLFISCPYCENHINLRIKSRSARPVPATMPTPDKSARPLNPPGGAAKLKQEVLGAAKDLPPMPQVAEKARKLTADPDTSFSDLAKLIETDPAIVTRVLKMANSAFYGAVGKIASVRQASVVLGIKTLNELLTLACASEVLNKNLKGYCLKPEQMWMHSLSVAALSKYIAQQVCPAKSDDVFAAGLIHDVGKLILDPYVFERKKLFATVIEKDNTWFAAEREVLGFDHAEIGSAICQLWRIPREITTAIRYHHAPTLAPEQELAHIIHSADLLARLPADNAETAMDGESLHFLGLRKEDVRKFRERATAYTRDIVC